MRHFLLIGCALLALAACSQGDGQRSSLPPPLVSAVAVTPHRFVDRIEAVGTANANEQVTLSTPVTQRITRLNFADGGYVARGQVIAVLAQGQEMAALAEAEARAREAEQQLARLQELKSRGFATNAGVDTQIAAAAAARASARAAEAMIGDRVIRAPFSGYVSLRTISPGAVVSAGTPIATIADLSRIKLDFTVPEMALAALVEGQGIVAAAAAYPDEAFRGEIATIDPIVDPTTRSVRVRALLPNPDRRLRPGMLMTVAIETQPRTRLAIPELAVVGQGDRRFVFVVDPARKVSRTEVRTGARDRGVVEIVNGLRPGQRVVGEGVVKVTDGMRVRLADKPAVAAAAEGG